MIPALLLLACQADPAPPGRFDDIVPDPTVTWTRTDVADRVPLGGATAARDQLLVVTDGAVGELTRALGATVIGTLPQIGLVQLRVDAPDAAGLEAAITAARAVPGVQIATPNLTLIHADCPGSEDNDALLAEERCAGEDVGYYPLARVADALRAEAPPRRVRVAVLDTGLAAGSGQFDDVPLYNLDAPGEPLLDLHGHGTRVAGLIAADDGDGGTAGFASTVLGDALELVVMAFDETTMGSLVGMIRAGGQARAQVANLSMGAVFQPGQEDLALAQNELYRRAAAAYPDTLYLTSSDNQPRETRSDNYTPAGLELPNFASVGGTAQCDPTRAWSQSGWGASVAIAAPAERVAVLNFDAENDPTTAAGPPRLGNGNSYSSPIVAAAAAILRAFDPSLSPAETLQRLRADAGPTDPSISGGALDLGRPLLTDLVERGVAVDLLDRSEPIGEADPLGLVAHRVCGTVDVVVDGLGSWRFDTRVDEGLFGAGQIFAGQLNIALGDATSLAVLIGVVAPFSLDAGWPISEEGPALMSFGSETHFGAAVGGALDATWCVITQRMPGAADTPAVVEVELVGAGTLQAAPIADPFNMSSHGFTLAGVIPMAVFTDDEATIEALEEVCDGGYAR